MPQAIETDLRKQRLLEELAARDASEAQLVSDQLGLQDPSRELPSGDYTRRVDWQRTTPVDRPGRARLESLDPSAAGAIDTQLGIQGPRIPKEEREKRDQESKIATEGSTTTEKGNIDLSNRPQVENADGSISTVKSMSINEDGKEVLIPMVREDGKMMDEKEAISHYHKTGKHLGKFNSVEEANAAAERIHQSEAKKLSSNKSGKAVPSSEAETAGGKTFDTLLQDAMSGNKNAIALVNSIGQLNGFDKIQVTKDGIQYQENGEWKNASPEDMRTMFDQAVNGIGYWDRISAKFSKRRQAPQQAPRQAIPTDLDPAVLRALRAKAILKGDVGDLVAYQRMPSQIDEAAASVLYRRAAAQRALQAARKGALQEYEYEYLDDGSRLKLDKDTKERLELRDPKGRLAPISRVGQMDAYSKELDAMVAEAEEDGAELIPNGTDNPTVKLPGGRKVSWTKYQLAKEKAKKVPRGQGNVATASTGGN